VFEEKPTPFAQGEGQTMDWDGVNKNLQQFATHTRQTLQIFPARTSC
jgi:hypothetical protein